MFIEHLKSLAFISYEVSIWMKAYNLKNENELHNFLIKQIAGCTRDCRLRILPILSLSLSLSLSLNSLRSSIGEFLEGERVSVRPQA